MRFLLVEICCTCVRASYIFYTGTRIVCCMDSTPQKEMVTGERDQRKSLNSGPAVYCRISATRATDPDSDPSSPVAISLSCGVHTANSTSHIHHTSRTLTVTCMYICNNTGIQVNTSVIEDLYREYTYV